MAAQPSQLSSSADPQDSFSKATRTWQQPGVNEGHAVQGASQKEEHPSAYVRVGCEPQLQPHKQFRRTALA